MAVADFARKKIEREVAVEQAAITSAAATEQLVEIAQTQQKEIDSLGRTRRESGLRRVTFQAVDYDDFEAARIKHLEFIQAVIARLGNDGFLTRGWALTVAGAFLGFAVNTRNRWLAIASMLPTLGFWWLDGYFLRAERLFRKLYGRVRAKNEQVEPFFMSATSKKFIAILDEQEKQDVKHWRVLLRPALLGLYLLLLAAAVLVFFIVIHISPAIPARKHP